MNDEMVLKWLIKDANQNAERYYDVDVWQRDLKDLLSEINSRRNIALPSVITSKGMANEEEIISILKDNFKNNVSNISLILNYLYPKKN